VSQPRARVLDALGTAALAGGIAVAFALVPRAEWSRATEPTTQAVYGFFLAIALIALARARGRARLERTSLALLLAAMPVVYLRAALEGAHRGARVWPEVLGLVLFAGAAAFGCLYPRLLAAGIVAHGIAWDLWHLGTGLVPDWYAAACAVVDAALGAYAASRIAAWSSSRGDVSSPR
jgi:hypothetical protein